MTWVEVQIQTHNEAEEAVSNILNEAGVSGISIENPFDMLGKNVGEYGELYPSRDVINTDDGITIKGYFSDDIITENMLLKLEKTIRNLPSFGLSIEPFRFSVKDIHEKDWVHEWEKYYKPVKISNTLTIKPTWESYHPSEGELVIELDPGMAFGTGTHATTTLCLNMLEEYLENSDTVLDIGCGSGVLSIASVLLGAKHVDAFDLDPIAVKSARGNIENNNMSEIILVEENDLLHKYKGKSDVVVANILADVIIKLIPDVPGVLHKGGYFITSGIIRKCEDDVVNTLINNGFKILDKKHKGDWVAIVASL